MRGLPSDLAFIRRRTSAYYAGHPQCGCRDLRRSRQAISSNSSPDRQNISKKRRAQQILGEGDGLLALAADGVGLVQDVGDAALLALATGSDNRATSFG